MSMSADQIAALRRAIARLQRDAELWAASASKGTEDTLYRRRERSLERYAREAAQDAILLQELLP